MTRVKPPFKTTGGRYYTAADIVKLFPPRGSYLTYLEPMLRSGAVLCARDPENVSEVVNDLDRTVTTFWKVLAQPDLFDAFQRLMLSVPFSGYEFQEAFARLQQREPDCFQAHAQVRRAADFFITSRMSFGGNGKNFSPIPKTRLRRGMNEMASAWLSAVDRLPEVHARLRRVAILEPTDVFELFDDYDRPDALIYLDPPWLMEEDSPDARVTAGLYGELDWDRDLHERLLTSLRRIRHARVALSGYRSRLYREQLVEGAGWTEHAFDVPLHAAGGAVKRRQQELLWTNY